MSVGELVILVDENGTSVGSAPKATIHGVDTPLHLAFSCYLRRSDGQILMTRRALTKKTWAGVWTNSFCGHPAPGESNIDAVHRRARQELGVDVANIEIALADFRYRAVDPGGMVEHEICPVFTATIVGDPEPDVNEIVEWSWAEPESLAQSYAHTPFVFSPWFGEQLPLLLSANALTDGINRDNGRWAV